MLHIIHMNTVCVHLNLFAFDIEHAWIIHIQMASSDERCAIRMRSFLRLLDDWIRPKPAVQLCAVQSPYSTSQLSHHMDYTATPSSSDSTSSLWQVSSPPLRTQYVGRWAVAKKEKMKEMGFVTERDLMDLAKWWTRDKKQWHFWRNDNTKDRDTLK